jgi:eukaryotic-like serine/threonine-protein kinase
MSASLLDLDSSVELGALGELTPISRRGGQGRVYLAEHPPQQLGSQVVVKLYRARPPRSAALALVEMVQWSRGLASEQSEPLHRLAAWPLATITADGALRGIVMHDVRARFEVPFLMPSGRTASVMLQLEHMLGVDGYLEQRGLPIALDTYTRAAVAERISAAFAFLHRHAIVVSDVSPSNLLISFAGARPEVCFIDCDSMVFHGRAALASVETGDWQMSPAFAEPPLTRGADAYKLGLLVLRLFARSHDARALAPHLQHVPRELRGLLARALSQDAPNRPTAGEWRLALRRTLADRALARHHPGPRPALAPAQRALRARRTLERAAPGLVTRTPSGRPSATTSARLAPARQGAGRPMFLPGFTVAWVLAGVLLLLLFARLVQSEALPSHAGGLGGERSPALVPAGRYVYRNAEGNYLPLGDPGQAEGYAAEPGTTQR